MTHTTAQTHPCWCVNVASDGPSRPCERDHVGRAYVLHTGETFAYEIAATAGQYAFDGAVPRARLSIYERESTGASADAYLTLAEVERLREMLDVVACDLRLTDCRQE